MLFLIAQSSSSMEISRSASDLLQESAGGLLGPLLLRAGVSQRIARDLRYPDSHHDCRGETDASERPVLPAVFHFFAVGRCGDCRLAGGADVTVKDSSWQRADPTRRHV